MNSSNVLFSCVCVLSWPDFDYLDLIIHIIISGRLLGFYKTHYSKIKVIAGNV